MKPLPPLLCWSSRSVGVVAAVTLVVAVCGCRKSADSALEEARAAKTALDDDACQTAFRQGLEYHPDDVELLILAAEFYQRPEAPVHYKPRLAIHYAQRADRAAGGERADAAAVLIRALLTMDQHEDAEEALRTALERHPDAVELQALSDPAKPP